MSRLRTRETIISPGVGLAPSLNVRTSTRKKKNCCTAVHSNCCNSSRVPGTHWVHTLGRIELTNLPASVAARNVSNCSQPMYSFDWRTASDPSTTAWLNPLSLGLKIDQPQKRVHLDSRAQPPSDFRDSSHRLLGRRFFLAQGQQRCARSNLCALRRWLCVLTQAVWSFVQKLEKGGVTRAVQNRCFVLKGNFLLRLG